MLACYNIAIALRGQDDALAPAAEAANERLRPLSCNSVLAVVTTVLQCVKREAPRIQAHSLHESSILNPARLAAGAVVSAIKEDPLGADLLLTFLGMAVSSYRWVMHYHALSCTMLEYICLCVLVFVVVCLCIRWCL